MDIYAKTLGQNPCGGNSGCEKSKQSVGDGLLRHGEKFYRLPGGEIEFGEKAAEALQREIKEEIGVEISVDKKLGVYENIFTFDNQKGHEIMILFEATLPPEYMQKDKIPMLEEEFEGRCYEFVEITADKRIYPAIFGDEEWQQYI